MKYRVETDSLGEVQVPMQRLYAAQTERSLHNFSIGQEVMPLEVIKALVLIKTAAADINLKRGYIPVSVGTAVSFAGKLIMDNFTCFVPEFPLHVWQTGSGTQSNMNVNEVMANLATLFLYLKQEQPTLSDDAAAEQLLDLLGTEKVGELLQKAEIKVLPNDHVNCSQSSNDTFPTAMHIVAYSDLAQLKISLRRMIKTFDPLISRYKHTYKSARTHLQDAVPMSFGQELSGWQALLIEAETAIKNIEPSLLSVALGATACGTGLNTPDNFSEDVLQLINELLQEREGNSAAVSPFAFRKSTNLFAALSGKTALTACHGVLQALAADLFKIANDIRYLASGPRLGYGEIKIPANEPGSSIMPGKVNPTQAEAMTMVATQVIANNQAIAMAAANGQFQLNVYMPLEIYNFHQSCRLLHETISSFTDHLLVGLEANCAKMQANFNASLMNVTALSPKIGYKKAAELAQEAHKNGLTLLEVVLKNKLMSREEYEKLMDPEKLSYPHGEMLS